VRHSRDVAPCRWVGHSITISGKHYANAVPDELFERARGLSGIAGTATPAPEPTQIPVPTPEPAPIALDSTAPPRRSGRRRMGPETSRNRGVTRSGPERGTPQPTFKLGGTCGSFPQVPVFQKNGAGGNRTPEHSRNLRENTPIPTDAQRRAQRGTHWGRNGAQDGDQRAARRGDQSRPRRGRTPGAATPRPTPTWPNWWRRGPTCRPTCGPGSSRRCAWPRPPADPARRPTEPTKPAMPRRGGPSPPVPSAATSAWFLPAGLADVTPAGTAAGID